MIFSCDSSSIPGNVGLSVVKSFKMFLKININWIGSFSHTHNFAYQYQYYFNSL